MTKYTFILLSRESGEFLSRLQELGMVDITRSSKPIDEHSVKMLALNDEYKKAISFLRKTDFSKEENYQDIEKRCNQLRKDLPKTSPAELLKMVQDCQARLAELKPELANIHKQAEQAKIWGDYDPEKIKGLADIGLKMHLYTCPKGKYSPEWKNAYPLEIASENEKHIFFAVVAPENETVTTKASEIQFPEATYSELMKKAASLTEELVDVMATTMLLKDYIPHLEADARKNVSKLDLYLATAATTEESKEGISVYTGFSPAEEDDNLCTALDTIGTFYLKEEAKAEDNPPIKLRNNKFTRMFEVLTGMYGMPVYNEFDPTPILGPFFLLFFAMCMGDAGYGILLFIIGFLLKKVVPSMAKLGPLVSTLGVATFVIGLVLGTFFGISLIDAEWYPETLKEFIIDGELMGFNIQMILAIGIGVFHICVAMIVKAICFTCAFGFRKTVSTWGWCLVIIGGIIIAALTLLGVMSMQITRIIIIVLGIVSALGIYVFNTPGRNPLVNVGAGLWDTYNMATGLLGDVLSYIRLYALGLAGGMLGGAFNDMALMAFNGIPVPGINAVVLVIILLIGHAINLAMSCLGAFVHPLRLTFVEYFKNSGYQGKGKSYKPLTNKQ